MTGATIVLHTDGLLKGVDAMKLFSSKHDADFVLTSAEGEEVEVVDIVSADLSADIDRVVHSLSSDFDRKALWASRQKTKSQESSYRAP